MVNNRCRGCFKSPVRVGVYCCGKGAELLIEVVVKVLHSFSEVFLKDNRVRVGFCPLLLL